MNRNIVRWLSIGILCLTAPWSALAQTKATTAPRPVNDALGFFSPLAEEQANRTIADIKKTFHKDLFVETMKAPPRPKDLDVKDKAAVDRFFDRYAEKRFADARVDGLYVMIIDNPQILRVVVGNNTTSKGYFTSANRDELVQIIREKLRANDKDGALTSLTEFVAAKMKANQPTAAARGGDGGVVAPGASALSGGSSWMSILVVVAIAALIFFVLRAVMGGLGGGAAGAGGGGGFLTSMLGGLFGAAAGMWIYNSFFGSGTSSAWGHSDHAADPNRPGSDLADTSGDAAGGDWGSNDGGDWGGGDVGGGDWGGGGGDW